MCVTYPGRVVSVDAGSALIDTEGRRFRASLLLVPETSVGDWVIVVAGTVVEVLDPDEARDLRTLLSAGEEEAP